MSPWGQSQWFESTPLIFLSGTRSFQLVVNEPRQRPGCRALVLRTVHRQFQSGYDRPRDSALSCKPTVEGVFVTTQRNCCVLECVFLAQQFFQGCSQFGCGHWCCCRASTKGSKSPPPARSCVANMAADQDRGREGTQAAPFVGAYVCRRNIGIEEGDVLRFDDKYRLSHAKWAC